MNNAALYDAALVAVASSNGAWISNPAPAGYAGELSAAQAIAFEVDLQIPVIITGATISQRQLLESIVKSVMIGRTPDSTSSYLEIAQAIAAVFTEYSPNLQDDDVGSYVLSVPSFAVLISLAGAVIGQKVRVESVGRSFEFTPPGTSPVQDAVVMNGVGGQWHSLEGTSDQKWLSQATWYVDAVTGNDENSGTALLPLKSTAEIQRRWGPDPTISIRITITYVNMPDVNVLHAIRASDDAGVDVIGIPINLLIGTVGTYVAKVPATNSGNMITSAAVADWTPYLGLRLLTNGTAVSFVRKVNPDGSGNNKCAISPPYQNGQFSPTNLIAGQELLIQTLPTCSSIAISLFNGTLNDGGNPLFIPALRIKNITVTKQCTFHVSPGLYNISIYGCDLVDLSVYPQGNTLFTTATRQRYAQTLIPQQWAHGMLLDKSPVAAFGNQYNLSTGDTYTTEWSHCEWSQMGIHLATVSAFYARDCQAWDWPAAAVGAIELPENGAIYLVNSFSGSSTIANTYGLKVRSSSLVFYNNLSAYTTGASGQIQCTGIGNFLWTDKPLYWAQAKGFDTLSAGTKPVIYKNIPADAKIFVTRNTPNGVVGNLSVPQATRTGLGTAASQFIVNSDNVGDTSTFDWAFFSPSNATGGMFSH